MHIHDSNVDSEWVSMYHWTVWLIIITIFNTRTPIYAVERNKFPCIITVTLLNKRCNERMKDFFPSGRYLIGIGFERRLTFCFFSYWKNKSSFHNFLCGNFKPSPMLFGVVGFFGRRTSRCETTGRNLSNLERIYSRYVLW